MTPVKRRAPHMAAAAAAILPTTEAVDDGRTASPASQEQLHPGRGWHMSDLPSSTPSARPLSSSPSLHPLPSTRRGAPRGGKRKAAWRRTVLLSVALAVAVASRTGLTSWLLSPLSGSEPGPARQRMRSPEDPSFRYWEATSNGPLGSDMFQPLGGGGAATHRTKRSIADLVDVERFGREDTDHDERIITTTTNNNNNNDKHNIHILWTYPIAPPPAFWNDVRSSIIRARSMGRPGGNINSGNVTTTVPTGAIEEEGSSPQSIHVTVICSYQQCLDAAVDYEDMLVEEDENEAEAEAVGPTTAGGGGGQRHNNYHHVRDVTTLEYRRINLHQLLVREAQKPRQQHRQQQQLASFRRFVDERHRYRDAYGVDFPHHTQNVALLALLHTCDGDGTTTGTPGGDNGDGDSSSSSSNESLGGHNSCCVHVWHDDDDDDAGRETTGTDTTSEGATTTRTTTTPVRHQRLQPVCYSDVVREEQFTRYRPDDSDAAMAGGNLPPIYLSTAMEYVLGEDLPPPVPVADNENSAAVPSGFAFDVLALEQFLPFRPTTSAARLDFGFAFRGGVDVVDAMDEDTAEMWKAFARRHGPVGAKDGPTLEGLRKRGIPSYGSTDFAQMLIRPRPTSPDDARRNSSLVMAVDVDPSMLPPHILRRATLFSTNGDLSAGRSQAPETSRVVGDNNNAAHLAQLFATEAKVVITACPRVAQAASAVGVPVIFVRGPDNVDQTSAGTGGGSAVPHFTDLFHQYGPTKSSTRLVRGRQDSPSLLLPDWKYDLDHIGPNPGVHAQDRYRASFWNCMKTRGPSQFVDTAYLFGTVPLTRLGRDVPVYAAEISIAPLRGDNGAADTLEPVHDLFHFIYTTAPDTLTWRVQRAIEAVYYHHPNARVVVHSNTLPSQGTRLDVFAEAGYDLSVQPYDLEKLLIESSPTVVSQQETRTFMALLPDRRSSAPYWYSHETDLVRMLLMEAHGGVYLDTDQHLVRPIPKSFVNVLGYQDPQEWLVNGAAMIFTPHNPFVQDCIREAMTRLLHGYDPTIWGIVGPDMLTDVWRTRYDPSSSSSSWSRRMKKAVVSFFGSLFGGSLLFASSPPVAQMDAAPSVDAITAAAVNVVPPIRVVPYQVFYPYHWSEVERCFQISVAATDQDDDDDDNDGSVVVGHPSHNFNNPIHRNLTLTVHLNTKQTSRYKSTVEGTVCDDVLHEYCIFCDEVYTQPEGLMV